MSKRMTPAVMTVVAIAALLVPGWTTATTYYVSSSAGSDANNGLAPGSAFQTIDRVNSLDLGPGDDVRLRCGDQWSGETLVIRDSGTTNAPIRVTSDPLGCPDQPVLSGALGTTGWQHLSGQIYFAELDLGGNAGRFPNGLNQVFRLGSRLPLGRWPNIGATAENGYSTIDAQPGNRRIIDNQLPAVDWTGAIFHFKSERYYLHSREVVAANGTQLTLNDDVTCRDQCPGWGFFLNHHLETLDQVGEWYYEDASHRLYLVSDTGAPADGEMEASPLPAGEVENQSGVILGGSYPEHVSNVIIQNLEVRDWAGSGVMMARLLRDDQNRSIEIRNNTIRNVGQVGIWLASFVYEASDSGNGPNGWRGGVGCIVADNLVDGANLYGIESFSVDSTFEDNEIRDIALLENLGRVGMGCGFEGTACPLSGAGLRLKIGAASETQYSGSRNTVRHNRFLRTGMVGVDIFGADNLIWRNVVEEACSTLADCGGLRTYGGAHFGNTGVRDNTFEENIVLNTVGNTDGAAHPYKAQWGHGFYIDQYSDGIELLDNTVTGSTGHGIAFYNSRGTVDGNTLFKNSTGTSLASHMLLLLAPTEVTLHQNAIVAAHEDRSLIAMEDLGSIAAADLNHYFSLRSELLIRVLDGSPIPITLADWQDQSGVDGDSVASWFQLEPGDPDPSVIFVNDTKQTQLIDLGTDLYIDLDQSPVSGSFTLNPFESRVLFRDEGTWVTFSDGFESGNAGNWSEQVP